MGGGAPYSGDAHTLVAPDGSRVATSLVAPDGGGCPDEPEGLQQPLSLHVHFTPEIVW